MLIKLLVLLGFVCGTAGMLFIVLSFVAFDSALRKIAQDHPESWIKFGKPIGFFWMPKLRCSTISGGFARSALYGQWNHRPWVELAAEDLPAPELIRMRGFAKMGAIFTSLFLALMLAAIATIILA